MQARNISRSTDKKRKNLHSINLDLNLCHID
jgi:hypothetical protein